VKTPIQRIGTTSTAIAVHDADYVARNDRWLTPLELIATMGTFDLDPAGAPGHATAREVWTPEDVGDGLSMPWRGRVWLNPPYGKTMGDWVERLAHHDDGGTALLYARTDAATFQRFVFPCASALFFIARRVKFLAPDGRGAGARLEGPAASVLIAYGDRDAEALRTCGLTGHYVPISRASQP
jgi:hypothetical protein